MRKVILVILLTAGVLLPLGAQDPAYNRPPLMPSEFGELPLGAIRPQGWLLQQLEAQRDGLTGRLDEVYPAVVGERNAWLGGDGDAWERGPYWIDGLLPLGYILQDNQLIAKAGRWVEAILSSGQENGFFRFLLKFKIDGNSFPSSKAILFLVIVLSFHVVSPSVANISKKGEKRE